MRRCSCQQSGPRGRGPGRGVSPFCPGRCSGPFTESTSTRATRNGFHSPRRHRSRPLLSGQDITWPTHKHQVRQEPPAVRHAPGILWSPWRMPQPGPVPGRHRLVGEDDVGHADGVPYRAGGHRSGPACGDPPGVPATAGSGLARTEVRASSMSGMTRVRTAATCRLGWPTAIRLRPGRALRGPGLLAAKRRLGGRARARAEEGHAAADCGTTPCPRYFARFLGLFAGDAAALLAVCSGASFFGAFIFAADAFAGAFFLVGAFFAAGGTASARAVRSTTESSPPKSLGW
jgi:hypothetical protein